MPTNRSTPRPAADERVRMPLAFAQFMRTLFGRRFHQFENRDRVQHWRKALLRLIDGVAEACSENVSVCDGNQRDELRRWATNAREAIRQAKTKDEISASAIAGLARICFQLLGGQPQNHDCVVVNKAAQLNVSHLRSMHYSQSIAQKAAVIRSLAARSDTNVPQPIRKMTHGPQDWELVERLRVDFPQHYAAWF